MRAILDVEAALKSSSDIIYGKLLGDGTISVNKRDGVVCTAYFAARHSTKQEAYQRYLYSCFPCEFWRREPRIIKNFGFGKWSCIIISRAWDIFREMRHTWYIENDNYNTNGYKCAARKIVPPNIGQYLTPRALAFWYMDDGSFSGQAVFHTNSFTLEENKLLATILKDKFNIEASIRSTVRKRTGKSYLYLSLDVDNSDRLFTLINQYVHESMQYKLRDVFDPIRTCIHCGNAFTVDRKTQFVKLCSDECRVAHNNASAQKRYHAIMQIPDVLPYNKCEVCGKVFQTSAGHRNSKVCSRKCGKAAWRMRYWKRRREQQGISKKVCVLCGREFVPAAHCAVLLTCSNECRTARKQQLRRGEVKPIISNIKPFIKDVGGEKVCIICNKPFMIGALAHTRQVCSEECRKIRNRQLDRIQKQKIKDRRVALCIQ